MIKETINNNFEHKKFDWTELKTDIRNDLEKFLYRQTNRRPVVLPVVMEVNQNRHRVMQKKNTTTTNDENTAKPTKKPQSRNGRKPTAKRHPLNVTKAGKKIVEKNDKDQ